MVVYEHKYNGRVLKGPEFFNEYANMVQRYTDDDDNLYEYLNNLGYDVVDIFHMEEEEKNQVWNDFTSNAIKIIDWRLQNGYTDWVRKEIED